MSDALVFLVELTGRHKQSGQLQVFRYGTVGFTTPGHDPALADTLYDERIDQAFDAISSVFAPGATSGQSTVTTGDVVLHNGDEALDPVMRDYAFDGRLAVMRCGEDDGYFLSDYPIVFVGVTDQANYDTEHVTFKLRGTKTRLAGALQTNRYTGIGALEGTTAGIARKPKPLAFGVVTNCAPPRAHATKAIYQPNDGPLASIDSVRDSGVPLVYAGDYTTLTDLLDDAQEPPTASYKVFRAGGYVRTHGDTAGTITCDVTQGATAADRTAAAIIRQVWLRAGVESSDIVASDLALLDAQNGAVLGLYLDTDISAAEVCDRIAATVGAGWGDRTDGKFRIVRLEVPVTPVVQTFTEHDCLRSPVREAAEDQERGLPSYQEVVRWGRNYTTQTDLAAGVDDTWKAFAAQEWRQVTATDSSVQIRHLSAVSRERDTLYAYEADAQREADRLLAMNRVQRHRFTITVDYTAETATRDLFDVVGFLYPRFGMNVRGDTEGQPFVVLGIAPNAKEREIVLTLWGNSLTQRNLATQTQRLLKTQSGHFLVTHSA